MHLLYVYQYYNTPDCAATARHYHYLRHLARRHRITLLTTRTYYDARLTDRFEWVPDNVDLRMLDVPYANQMGTSARLRAYTAFAARACLEGLRLPRPDLVFGTSTPLTAAWAAREIARLKRVPWVFEVRDLWPDFPVQMGAIRNPLTCRALYGLERALYRSAAHVLTLSTDMEAHVRSCGVPPERVSTLVHGSDLDLLDACTDDDVAALRAAHGLSDTFVVLYGGTLGRANAIPTLIDAARRLTHRSDIRFVFAGEGYYADHLADASRKVDHVLLLPPQPLHRMLCWFRLADLSLVSFADRPVLATNSPAKFFDSLSAGTPVIVTNPGWTKAFVETHGCGWAVPPEDPAALADQITRIVDTPGLHAAAARRAHDVARPMFDRRQLARQFEAVLEGAARS